MRPDLHSGLRANVFLNPAPSSSIELQCLQKPLMFLLSPPLSLFSYRIGLPHLGTCAFITRGEEWNARRYRWPTVTPLACAFVLTEASRRTETGCRSSPMSSPTIPHSHPCILLLPPPRVKGSPLLQVSVIIPRFTTCTQIPIQRSVQRSPDTTAPLSLVFCRPTREKNKT